MDHRSARRWNIRGLASVGGSTTAGQRIGRRDTPPEAVVGEQTIGGKRSVAEGVSNPDGETAAIHIVSAFGRAGGGKIGSVGGLKGQVAFIIQEGDDIRRVISVHRFGR